MRNNMEILSRLNNQLNDLLIKHNDLNKKEKALKALKALKILKEIKSHYPEDLTHLFGESTDSEIITIDYSVISLFEAEDVLWLFHRKFKDPGYLENVSLKEIRCFLFSAKLAMDSLKELELVPYELAPYHISKDSRDLLLHDLPKNLLLAFNRLPSLLDNNGGGVDDLNLNQNQCDRLMYEAIIITLRVLINSDTSLQALADNAGRLTPSVMNHLRAIFSSTDLDFNELPKLIDHIEAARQGKPTELSSQVLNELFKVAAHEASSIRSDIYNRGRAYNFQLDTKALHSRLNKSAQTDTMDDMPWLKTLGRVLQKSEESDLQTQNQQLQEALRSKENELTEATTTQQLQVDLHSKENELTEATTTTQQLQVDLRSKESELTRMANVMAQQQKLLQKTTAALEKKSEAMLDSSKTDRNDIDGSSSRDKIITMQAVLKTHSTDLKSHAENLKSSVEELEQKALNRNSDAKKPRASQVSFTLLSAKNRRPNTDSTTFSANHSTTPQPGNSSVV